LLVEHWHSAYDFVLIDLPPLLLSADAELLVGALGQVFMVVEAQSVNKGEVSRAKRMLEKLDPEAVGLFVDNVPLFREPASGYLHEVMLETITKTSPKKFMTLPGLKLQYELLRVRWAIWRSRKPQPERKSS
jgi:succinoglycan biosynthesis transport protein ExoP